jgi:hypothetical protein
MTRAIVRMRVDRSKAERRLAGLRRQLPEAAKRTLAQAAQYGRDYAKTIAPYYSGKTTRLIKAQTGDTSYQATIVSQNPTANDGKDWSRSFKGYSKPFNLVRWMHTSPRAAGHIRSGDRKYMYTTAAILRREFPKTIRQSFKSIFIRNR